MSNDPKEFCTCKDTACPMHPANHDKGCALCILKNQQRGEIPSCFFKLVNPDISGLTEFTFESFVSFYEKNRPQKD